MIGRTQYRVLNQISWWSKCRVCGKRNRRYRYCGGDRGCVANLCARCPLPAEPGTRYCGGKYGCQVNPQEQPIAEFPHCNSEVLHAPGTCQYCDMYPDKQAIRAAGKTPFTPAESNGWYGNVAVPNA